MRPQNVAGVAGTGALIMAAGALADQTVFHVRLPCVRNAIETSPAHFLCMTSAYLSYRALYRAIHRVYP